MADDDIRRILESAIQAPSADNHHRIRFAVDDDRIRVFAAEDLVLRPEGYQRLLALLSLGAVVENLRIAASRFGVAVDTRLLPEPERPDLLLNCRLQDGGAVVDALWQRIPERHTCRTLRFHGPSMSEAQRAELATAVDRYSPCRLIWLDRPDQRPRVLRLMRLAETERFRNPLLHAELFSAVRFDVGWHGNCAEGLPPGSLAVEPPLRPFFALLRHWPVAKAANRLGMHRLLGVRSCDLPCRLAPHLGVLTVEKPDPRSLLDAGSAFQRLWLTATAHGRVLQPLPASALYAAAGAQGEGIPDILQQTLVDGWRELVGTDTPVMVFRMGFAAPSPIVTGRQPLAHYLRSS
ncbi:MAG TPA: hypothetical protein PKZ22_14120 [Accumulibacter sp.]|nr:hypothetical protein [Accumulibacter sp.]